MNSSKLSHSSDCAVHDEPAYSAGPCTCGAFVGLSAWYGANKRELALPEELDRALTAYLNRIDPMYQSDKMFGLERAGSSEAERPG